MIYSPSCHSKHACIPSFGETEEKFQQMCKMFLYILVEVNLEVWLPTFFKMYVVYRRRKSYRFAMAWGWVTDEGIFIYVW